MHKSLFQIVLKLRHYYHNYSQINLSFCSLYNSINCYEKKKEEEVEELSHLKDHRLNSKIHFPRSKFEITITKLQKRRGAGRRGLRSAKVHQESWKNFSNYWSSIPGTDVDSHSTRGWRRESSGGNWIFGRALSDNNGIGLVQLRGRIRSLNGAT